MIADRLRKRQTPDFKIERSPILPAQLPQNTLEVVNSRIIEIPQDKRAHLLILEKTASVSIPITLNKIAQLFETHRERDIDRSRPSHIRPLERYFGWPLRTLREPLSNNRIYGVRCKRPIDCQAQ